MADWYDKAFGEARLKTTSKALKVGGLVLLAAGAIDLGLSIDKKIKERQHLAIQEAQLDAKKRKEDAAYQRFLHSSTYIGTVQNLNANKTGHYKMGNAKF